VPADAGVPEPAPPGVDAIVPGGATRSDSVRCGLAAVPEEAAVIVVHDAARPLASSALFEAVIAAVTDGGADGAVPGVPPSDTRRPPE
jgi:2-C-methyl-D-erythritol 4-phosphate cytidylyltransferase